MNRLIKQALAEDVGSGDVTTEAVVPKGMMGQGTIRTKQNIVVAGLCVARKVFETVDKKLVWEAREEDGARIGKGEILAVVKGSVARLLTAERTALNFLQHTTGVATLTDLFVKRIAHTETKILDTRKTIPGLRLLEKDAVRLGAGENHRMGLFDRYLIKNNHISIAGSVTNAIKSVNKDNRKGLLVEVEVRNLDELGEALQVGVDIVMLDNFSVGDVGRAVEITDKKAKIEVSGNITLENVAAYAETGVDFISVGAITHSAPAADIHMVVSRGG